jgi:hypothetical protein
LVEIVELAINLVGLAISAMIGRFAYSGYATIASPNLLRLTLAFASIAVGFGLIIGSLFTPHDYSQSIDTAGLAAQAVGYFFIAMSHGLKSSFDFVPKGSAALALVPLAATGFVIPGNSIEHLVRSISFILLVYVSIETLASYMQTMRTNTLMIGSGLGTLAVAELLAWYDFIFPGTFSYPALAAKVAGFGLMFIPYSKFGLASGFGRGIKQDAE